MVFFRVLRREAAASVSSLPRWCLRQQGDVSSRLAGTGFPYYYYSSFGSHAKSFSNTTANNNHNISSNKVVGSAEEALQGLDLRGATLAVGGFGVGGIPETLLTALASRRPSPEGDNWTVISVTGGIEGQGAGKLISSGKVRRLLTSYVGENQDIEDGYFSGTLQVELTPMGTIVERLRAGGVGKQKRQSTI